ncbi:MAG: M91 family zinc metallopeptidase [Bacteroidota bacterium]
MRQLFSLLLLYFLVDDAKSQLKLPSNLQGLPTYESTRHAKEILEKNESNPFNPLGPKAQLLHAKSQKEPCRDINSSVIEGGLWIHYEGKLLEYASGKFFDEIKKDFKDKKRIRKTVRKLQKLENKSNYARNIIQTLQHSTNRFVLKISSCKKSYMVLPIHNGRKGILNNNAYAFQIMDTNTLMVNYAPFDRIGSGAEIRWNCNSKLVCLAHELAHAFDANFGLMDDRLMMVNGGATTAREVRAIYHENKIRKELGKQLRRSVHEVDTWIVRGEPITYILPDAARR